MASSTKPSNKASTPLQAASKCSLGMDPEQNKAFSESKTLRPKLPLTLVCDASAYGISAVLVHRMHNGSEKPTGYASRTLNKAEKNYSQLKKEGLSLVFGIKKFYPYGHSLVTDHRPLLGLLGEARST